MKKNLFIAAMGLLVLAGCSNNEEIDNVVAKADNAITFEPYVGKVTKAKDKGDFVTNEAFGVIAQHYQNTFSSFSANFMNNVKITYSSGWDYETPSDTKYWPNDETNKLAFVAYFPYNTTAPTINSGAIQIPFTVKALAADQEDFMWSTIIEATKTDKDGTKTNGQDNTANNTTTAFIFKHALSKVLFQAKLGAASYTGATIEVTKITINGIGSTGNFTINTALNGGGWDNPSAILNFSPIATGSKTAIVNDTATPIGASLLMIPQALDTKTIDLEYTINYTNPATTITETKQITFTGNDSWVTNKQYTYIFTISLTGVTFDATVASWENNGSTPL